MRRAASVVAVALLLAIPFLTANQFLLHLGITVLMWTVLGVAWNLLAAMPDRSPSATPPSSAWGPTPR